MDKPFVSVIMPVYNVEKYVERAIRSVLNQTYSDFELILIDDCSTDKSGQICDKMSKESNRIKAIHLDKNVGLSGARNFGLTLATGKYVFFMDSDDYIEYDLFKTIYKEYMQNSPQLLIWGLTEEYYGSNDNLKYTKSIPSSYCFLNNAENVRFHTLELEEKTLLGYAWNKAYSLDHIKKLGIRYKNITLIEDIIFNLEFIEDIDKITILEGKFYHYRKGIESSLTSKFLPNYFELNSERVQKVLDQQKRWNVCTDEAKNILANIYVRYIISALQRNCDKRSNMNHMQRKAWAKSLFNNSLFNELIPYFKSENLILSFLGFILKHRMTLSVLSIARFIYIIKKHSPIIFSKLKQNR